MHDHTDHIDHEQRPWGSWHILDVNRGYKVKRIHVTSGRRLSYQSHQYRSEHWTVISGWATCTVDGVTSLAGPGSSIHIPVGAKHRLANLHSDPLVVIEVQRGPYTGEDDIERFEDDFGRVASVARA